jgi:transposase
LEDGLWKSRIADKKVTGVNRWRGDEEARRAVYNNRARLRSGVARAAFRLRGELVERSFALTLDRGGMRRAWLRGREKVHKRYLVHVAGYNLGLIMRLLVGAGTPREFLARVAAHLVVVITAEGAAIVILAPQPTPKQRYSSSAPSRRRQTDSRLHQRAVTIRMAAVRSIRVVGCGARGRSW